MKPIKDETISQFEEVAVMGVKALREFFTYQGDNPKYFQRARLGAAAISGYARIRASEANRMAIEQVAMRQVGAGSTRKQIA